jgi:hypothetical protein
MFVETLTDFMFFEGWTIDTEVPYKSHEHDWRLQESDDYFNDLQYGDYQTPTLDGSECSPSQGHA